MNRRGCTRYLWTAVLVVFLMVNGPVLSAYADADIASPSYAFADTEGKNDMPQVITDSRVNPDAMEKASAGEDSTSEDSAAAISDTADPSSEDKGEADSAQDSAAGANSGSQDGQGETSADGTADPESAGQPGGETQASSEGQSSAEETEKADAADSSTESGTNVAENAADSLTEATSGETAEESAAAAGNDGTQSSTVIEESADEESVQTSAAMAGAQEILAEKVDGSKIAVGDKIVIVSNASGSAISTEPSGSRLNGAQVTIQETTKREVITELSDDAAIFEVVDAGNGEIALHCSEGYLTSADSGNGLFYSSEIADCSKWKIEDEVFLYNPYAVYSSGGNDNRNQYLEFYNSNFTTYGKNPDSFTTAFTMSFFRMGNSDPDDVIPETDDYYLPLFETSDVHGYLADTSGDEPLYLLAYISDKVNDTRKEQNDKAGGAEGEQNDKVLLLDTGDIYQGNTLSNLFYGKPLSAAFQIMEYDAVSIGNHEFDWGIENTIDSDGTMMDYEVGNTSGVNSVPVVMCNMFHNGEKITFADDYIILEKKAVNKDGDSLPVKIAVIGYAGEYSTSIMYNMFTGAGYTIDPDFEQVNSLAKSLEDQGLCDATILLAHHEATEVAEGLGDGTVIDLVLGGHTHQNTKGKTSWGLTYLEPESYSAAYAYTELAFGVEDGSPVFIKAANAKTVPTKTDTSLLTNTEENADELDPELVDLTDEVVSELADILESKIGYITESALRDTYLPDSGNRSTTCGNWMASILARAVGADAAFVNNGGIRTEVLLEEGKDKRDITLSDVYTLFPFGNKIYCYEITYEEFLQLLQYSLSDKGKGLVSQLAGIYCYYTDETVNAIVTKDGQEVYVNGEWKDGWKDKKMKVASNEYVCTSNRQSSNGLDNPLYLWKDTSRLVSNELVDNEAAITVLTDEGAENDGHLIVDSNAYFVNKTYESKETTEDPEQASTAGTTQQEETPAQASTGTTQTQDSSQEASTDSTEQQEDVSEQAGTGSTAQQEETSEQANTGKASTGSTEDSSQASTSGESSSAATTEESAVSDKSGQDTSTDSSGTADSTDSSKKSSDKNKKSGTSEKSPGTGDTTPVLFWVIVAAAAAAAVLILWFLRKKGSGKDEQ